MADLNDESKKKLEDLNKTLREIMSPVELVSGTIADMVQYSDELNRNFALGRSRIQEMNVAFANSSVVVAKLGGSLSDVTKTISEIAAASNRNVIENELVVSQLYAASKILGTSAQELTNQFKNVGYETSQIGVNLENSITYIQSVGLNARTVMSDVSANMEKMNRYQFEGGVIGLTKMAAQASMLRFSMSDTFNFAEKVLRPEDAINMAATFQRLGVLAGNLVDPFAMMNESLTNPAGLQDSLARVGQQFTYFSEETQSFKISRQGVLILKEMEEAAGLTSGTLSKSALAAADLDKRLSEVGRVGLKFENEEDKQYLTNILSMGKDSKKYEVTLNDGTRKELQNLNQEEFDKLIDQQKNAPKTLEDIQKSQLSVTENLAADAKAILNTIRFGAATAPELSTNIEGLRNIVTKFADVTQKKVPTTGRVREFSGEMIQKMMNLIGNVQQGSISLKDIPNNLSKIESMLVGSADKIGDEGVKVLKEILNETAKGVTGSSNIEKFFRKEITGDSYSKQVSKNIAQISKNVNPKGQMSVSPISGNQIMGVGTTQKNYIETTKEVNTKIDFGGTIVLDIKAPVGVSEQQFKQWWKQLSESEDFARAMTQFNQKQLKKLEKIS